ncbi:MAG: hypothetical protein V1936_02765 [Patescibacteria group bacterium]
MALTADQQSAWLELMNICYKDGQDRPQTMFSAERLAEIESQFDEARQGIRDAVGAVAVASSSAAAVYKLPDVLSPADAVALGIKGIYDSGIVNPSIFAAGKLLLQQPEVVAAIQASRNILALLREKVLPDLDAKAADPKAGIRRFGTKEINFGDGNRQRAEEISAIIREKILAI